MTYILNTVPLLPRIIWMSATKDNVLRRDMNDSVGLRPHLQKQSVEFFSKIEKIENNC